MGGGARGASSVVRTKGRDVWVLGVRTGRVAVGHTTQDAVGFLAALTEAESGQESSVKSRL